MTEAPVAPEATASPCRHCRASRFWARGARWCFLCDRQTPETLAARGKVKR